MKKIGKLVEKCVDIQTHQTAQDEKILATANESRQIQETAGNLDNPLHNVIRDYRDALLEGQQLDSQLDYWDINTKAESDLQSLSQLLGLSCTVLASTVKDDPPIYKLSFIEGHSVTIQMPDNTVKLIEVNPMVNNFKNLQNELASNQDLKGLLIAIKLIGPTKAAAATKCS